MKRRWLLVLPALFAIVAVASSPKSVATFAGQAEPGTRLIVSGRVFDPADARGVAGVKLYAYHTDAKGIYGPLGGIRPRLKGTVVTDSEGRFEWRTIRPMPYPGGGNPAHIHVEVSASGYPKQFTAVEFMDDPYITAAKKEASRAQGKFAPIVTTTRDGKGVLHATFNIRLSHNPSR